MSILNNVSNFSRLLNLSEYLLLQQASIQQTTEENTGQLERAYQFINSAQESLHEHVENVQVSFILTVRCVYTSTISCTNLLTSQFKIHYAYFLNSVLKLFSYLPTHTGRNSGRSTACCKSTCTYLTKCSHNSS